MSIAVKEFEARQLLMERLDKNLLNHARELCAGDGPRIVDVYCLQGLAEVHCYLKTAHEFNAAEVEALLHFADPLNVAYNCWEENTHEYSFPICDLLRETNARECFAPAESEPPQKPSVREQLQAAMQAVRQQSAQKERQKGGDPR